MRLMDLDDLMSSDVQIAGHPGIIAWHATRCEESGVRGCRLAADRELNSVGFLLLRIDLFIVPG